MARTSRETHRGFNTTAYPSASTPTECPVCGEIVVVGKGEKRPQVLEAHLLAQHRPEATCRHEHRSDAVATWKLDWDSVIHQQGKLWYCSECGFYLTAA